MAEPIVRAVDVTKVYDTGKVKVEALRGVDLSIERGEMVAIVGPSGCGKTTLLNVLSSLDDLTSGEAFIEGEPIQTMSDRKRTRYRAERMGFVFQFFNLLPVLSAAENVELPLLVAGVKPHEARTRAREALALVGLAGEEDKRPAEVSGGQQQRVSIARALVNRPAIVWGDEPTGSLDSENSASIMELLRELNGEHDQTFVLVTHDPTVAAATDRIIRMRDGRIEDDGRGNGAGAEAATTGRPAAGTVATAITVDAAPRGAAVDAGSADRASAAAADGRSGGDESGGAPATPTPSE
jgi:ABC-type lipoprotein export system ATPase subunit